MKKYSVNLKNIPLSTLNRLGAFDFKDDSERFVWVRNYVRYARQKLSDTGRWTKKGLLHNLNGLNPWEQDLDAAICNMKLELTRVVKGRSKGNKDARTLVMLIQRLLNTFFEGKVRSEGNTSGEDLLNED